uniref:DNA-directed RNA polymerase n=1 Tax=Caulerpa lentillifera TaxID=148947 RepID=A0A345HH11_9CHLO|nr:RNA polymerase b-subunit [Caulerpa lentillifera]AXG75901.1 RNA polymerase b-subunit [Caulerpa lentillifera]QKS32260.1 RNA polymerase b-subunit [Caulerpa lentillifera]
MKNLILMLCLIFYKFLFFLSDFLEIQRKSFYWFLNNQFGKEFSLKQTPGLIFSYDFIYNNYKFLRPALNIQESIIRSKTYCCNFYIPVRFSFLNESTIQWVFLGTLPLLTRRGHFIINGTPRIVLNQIVRSPGVYFRQNSSSVNLYYAEIIFQRGPWLRLEMDSKKKIWICIQDIPRLPLETFLQNFHQKYKDNILFRKQSQSSPILIQSLNLQLGFLGRSCLNKKLNTRVQNLSLTPIDLVAISNKLYELTGGSESESSSLCDDIDDLRNRRLKTIGELLKNQLTRGLIRLKNFFIKKNKKFDQIIETSSPSQVLRNLIKIGALNSQPINSTFKEFFHSHQLSQYLDQSNPLAEITHKRRLSCLGSGGISNETAGMEIRGIHRTHYGRICPIETPEGRNAGLVNSLTIAVALNFQGFLETPFVEIYKQHLQNQKKIVFFCVEKQMSQNVFFNQKLGKSKNLFVPIIKSQTQKKCAVDHIHFLAFHPQQFISIGATCIPFVEHNDANRVLMGSNMQRQALPLLKLEQPIVNTLNSFRILSDLRDIPTTFRSGIITYSSSKVSKINHPKINLLYENQKKKPISKPNILGLEKIQL